jgi:hypothetical protein
MTEVSDLQNTERVVDKVVTRRQLVELGGVALVATSLLGTTGCATAMGGFTSAAFPPVNTGAISPQTLGGVQVGSLNGGTKPIYVAPPGSMDPVAHSVADTLFWGEQLMEHAAFMAMLMPGPELAAPRREAEQFEKRFSDHLARLRGGRLDASNYQQFNATTLNLTSGIIDYKHRMEAAQSAGQIRSLAWPMFFAHIRHEAERFARRLAQLNAGNAAFDRREVVPFWADKMEEHSLFVAHLLDPSERALIGAAETSAGLFGKLERAPVGSKAPAMAAAQQIINFKVAAEKGIQSGQIKSIINPALADHVRREAIRLKDELERSV